MAVGGKVYQTLQNRSDYWMRKYKNPVRHLLSNSRKWKLKFAISPLVNVYCVSFSLQIRDQETFLGVPLTF